MKLNRRNCTTLILLTVLFLVGVSGSVLAADFFPLDIREEMVAWQRKTNGPNASFPETLHALKVSIPGSEKKAYDVFPWDVLEELNALGKGAGGDAYRFAGKIDGSGRNRGNPYWLPDELQSDHLPSAAADNFADLTVYLFRIAAGADR
jgi:hypothetical protein